VGKATRASAVIGVDVAQRVNQVTRSVYALTIDTDSLPASHRFA